MHIVDLSGSPESIGFGHGRALTDEIAAHLERWTARLVELGVADPNEFIDDLVGGSGFIATAEEFTPDLADEIAALSDGACIRPAEAWFLQLMDESWAALRARRLPQPPGLGCTSYGVVAGVQTWSGQTMDLERFRTGAQAALRIKATDRPPEIVITMAGCVGLLGVSQAGFAVLVNALAQVPAVRNGLPVALMTRAALAADSVTEAAEWLRSTPHATGQHYLVAGSEQLVSLECSPAGIAEVMPGSMRQWHTNHPLVGYLPEPDDAESEARWDAVQPIMKLPGWGRRRTRELLEMPPVCRTVDADTSDGDAPGGDAVDGVVTFAACTVEQNSGGLEVWVTDGPPDPDAWQHIDW